ncbi:MAG TPA: phosphotransferase, partial [Pedobacter sp.]
DFDIRELSYTIANFHNLSYRFFQFEQALAAAAPERRKKAKEAIQQALMNRDIVNDYEDIVAYSTLPLRVMHHDTKINNILFDHAHKGICVIDLDTVMPGYFISDIGDMMRTYLSPCNEEEEDLDKISIREDFFAAIAEGYFLEMGSILTGNEKRLFYYAGKFMMYMQAIRFLTDYLNNDVYYQARHPDHNLNRANNQFTLLELYKDAEIRFQSIIAQMR